MPEFISGLQLSQDFYHEAVAPILARRFAGLPHAAALLGYGSEVLGLDDAVSRDHMWGPRLRLFLPEEGFAERQAALHEALRAELPPVFRGYSVHFGAPNPADGGVRVPGEYAGGPVEHMVAIHTPRGFVEEELGFDPARAPEPADWVCFPEQNLLTLTAGAVFHDDLGLSDDDPFAAITANADLLAHVHVATRANRLAPGMEDCPELDGFFAALRASGYAGRVSIEAALPADLPGLTRSLEMLRAWAG